MSIKEKPMWICYVQLRHPFFTFATDFLCFTLTYLSPSDAPLEIIVVIDSFIYIIFFYLRH
jgi:hypothetical protein